MGPVVSRRVSARGRKRQADLLFSRLVRAAGRCESCGSTRALQCAHIDSRRYLRIRWERLNALCLCARCHLRYTDRPLEFAEFVATVRTPQQLEQLRHLRECGPRPDVEDVIQRLRAELADEDR